MWEIAGTAETSTVDSTFPQGKEQTQNCEHARKCATPNAPKGAMKSMGENSQRAEAQPQPKNRLLLVQLLICILLVGGALAVRWLSPAAFAQLRRSYTAMLQPMQSDLLQEERELARFVQKAATVWQERAQETLSDWLLQSEWEPPQSAAEEKLVAPQSVNAARQKEGEAKAVDSAGIAGNLMAHSFCRAHLKPTATLSPPYGNSLECYEPPIALTAPLCRAVSINSGYGWRQDPVAADGTKDFHTGLDLAAAEGTPVYACAQGMVRRAQVGASYGNFVRVLHAGGDETVYAHLQYVFVHPGEWVAAGQCIGTVGSTGRVTGAHLHFEILHCGVRHDPSKVVATW